MISLVILVCISTQNVTLCSIFYIFGIKGYERFDRILTTISIKNLEMWLRSNAGMSERGEKDTVKVNERSSYP